MVVDPSRREYFTPGLILETGARIHQLDGHHNWVNSVAVSPDGTRAYVTNTAAGGVSVINTATNHITATIHGLCSPFGGLQP